MPQEARNNNESPPRWPERFRPAERALLPQCMREVTCIRKVQLFGLPMYDFFNVIRNCYNRRNDSTAVLRIFKRSLIHAKLLLFELDLNRIFKNLVCRCFLRPTCRSDT
ncbi:hypothetical protein NPIL_113261 [Nephila pilipes]|uniref:Uncharacterized protein n=1 Tax=Nephila pilipes TaxID=299642 RepID=A0A8X6NR09_NEPPI|nr:hypothetical protein NPIL_113261 [Nephila pilipes]